MWLIAGPNGSGKSTIVDDGFIEKVSGQAVATLNADERTRQILTAIPSLAPEAANLRAAREIDAEVDALIEARASFAVETVLSSDKYKSRIERCRERGYRVALVFVTLATAQDSIDRVRLRVQLGGHDVPPEKIRARWERSLSNLPWFAAHADLVLVFDNTLPATLGDPVLLASKQPGGQLRLLHPGVHPRVDAELRPLLDDDAG